ncbi:MAG: PrsW family intramembrane metalloprotease [Planctomycetes bacterium]|nr:PrsW family intramembrane metalloprotease [Planctomycetota bacterium]
MDPSGGDQKPAPVPPPVAGANPAPPFFGVPARASRLGRGLPSTLRLTLGTFRRLATVHLRPALHLAWDFFSPRELYDVLRHPVYWVALLAATAPIFIIMLRVDLSAMMFYFSLLWAYVFYRLCDLGQNLLRKCAFSFAFAVLVSLFVFPLYLQLPPRWVDAAIVATDPRVRFLGYVLGVGVREEVCKGLGVLLSVWLLHRLRWSQLALVEGMLYAAMGGFGFAAVENVRWMQDLSLLQESGQVAGGAFQSSFARVVLVPFVHACWTGIMGYFVVRASREPLRHRLLLGAALVVPAALHGLFDFAVSLPELKALALLTVGLSFYLYLKCLLKVQGEGRLTELDRRLV